MKKRFLSILAILAVFCIALVGCGGSAPQEKDPAANFYGEWEYVAADGENPIDEEAAAEMKELGLTFKIYLGEDGTWAFTAVEDEILVSGTWEATSETEATLTSDGSGSTSTVTLDPETGRIRYDNGSSTILILERIGDAATAPVASGAAAEESTDSGSDGKSGSGLTNLLPADPVDYSAEFVGDWELVEMTADDPEDAFDAGTVQQLKDAGYVAILTLNADGTFILDVFGDSEMSGTWSFDSETSGTIFITSEGSNQRSPLEYDPATGRLGIVESHDTLYFVRV